MSHISEDLVRLMSNVTLTQPMHVPVSNNEAEQENELCVDMQALSFTASELAAAAQQAHDINEDGNTRLSRRIAAIGLVLKRSAEITRTAHVLEDSAVSCIKSRLMSHPDAQGVRKLLLHFESELERVIKKSYEDAEWGQASMVEILQACHIEASSGSLRVEDYFDSLYEAACESPYDPDLESEAYYDHENRLLVDEGYAEAEGMRKTRRQEEQMKNEMGTHRAWIGFWVRLLHLCQGGPTLFWPYPRVDGSEDLPNVPRYLFRTFDIDSSGKSDKDVVASSASMHLGELSRKDLLSFELDSRAAKLGAHLSKTCFGTADCSDNLMSWSSSMLFVLQYAIWRWSKGRLHPADIYICALDTTKFPRGQFARDTWLLQQCRRDQNELPSIAKALRLRKLGYDNGEYLSQGLLIHQNRSAVTTLEDLIKSGLHELYPEFKDPNGNQMWTNRVHDLRSAWAQPQSTSNEELETASRIATTCFRGLPARELATCLLTLKNRKFKSGSSTGTISLIGGQKDSLMTSSIDTQASKLEWLEKEPAEVQRSIRAIQALNSKGPIGSYYPAILSQMFVRADLEDLFSCI
jgi:hypothetical protein